MAETATKERPILFSTELVRAILDGRKSVTRRVVKPQPEETSPGWWKWQHPKYDNGFGCDYFHTNTDAARRLLNGPGLACCPFGDPGTLLWVREAFQYEDAEYEPELSATNPVYPERIWYRADDPDAGPWRPSIHMPRWASRLTLEVSDVRVEQLQDITEEEAIAEGFHDWPNVLSAEGRPRYRFRMTWDQFNPKHPWASNPWVWRVEFRRVEQ